MSSQSRRSFRVKAIVILGAIALVVVLIYSTMQQNHYRYRVCMTFNAQIRCATAAGATPEEAIHSAHDVDCAQLANGRDQNMVCLATEPSEIQSLTERQPLSAK